MYRDANALRQAAQAILRQYQVQGLIRLQIEEQVSERTVRAYGSHPAEMRLERSLQVSASVDEAALSAATRRLGWRVYATNHPAQTLTLEQAVLAYREEYLVERGVGRVIGQPLSLSPMYVQSDQRALGLIHLLSLALRVLTRLQGQCRQWVADGRPARTCRGLVCG